MHRPLADRMRPQSLDDVVGQDHLVGPNGVLRRLAESKRLPSLILWGPPGCGKTTLAQILARNLDAQFASLTAVTAGIKDLRELADTASKQQSLFRQSTVVFVDEIHRFNKAQQDALLPHVERGTFTLIGATTENPGFEINAALLSRCSVFEIKPIDATAMSRLIDRAMTSSKGVNEDASLELTLTADAKEYLIVAADGDARAALTILEVASQSALALQVTEITVEFVEEANQYRSVRYDKAGDNHYQTVSAFIKSMRGSDPNAALYYMTRMLEGGEDPNFILRRMVIFASEDIGNADPRALSVAMDAQRAFHFMGMPEGVLPMTQACTYLATAPKSNAVITAYARARGLVRQTGTLPIPDHLVNAVTKFGRQIGKGRGYKYPHNFEGNYVPENYLPDAIRGQELYIPTDNGYEAEISARMATWRATTEATEKDDTSSTDFKHGESL